METAEPTLQIEVTPDELRLIQRALLHSANIFRTFCLMSDPDPEYQDESVNARIEMTNALIRREIDPLLKSNEVEPNVHKV
jgi:hypothetical protein